MLKARLLLLPVRAFRIQPPLLQRPCSVIWNHRLHSTWTSALRFQAHESVPKSCWNFFLRKYHRFVQDSRPSCGRLVITGIFGLSVVTGSISLWRPQIGHCTNGFELESGDHDPKGMFDPDEDRRALLSFVRKLLVPIFLFSTVLMNWGHPFIIAAKVALILFTTKPSPLSVYFYIEELRQQLPFRYRFKSYSAEEVEIEDYTFLCLARVKLKGGRKLDLLGILGNWWVLPLSIFRAGSMFDIEVQEKWFKQLIDDSYQKPLINDFDAWILFKCMKRRRSAEHTTPLREVDEGNG